MHQLPLRSVRSGKEGEERRVVKDGMFITNEMFRMR